MPVSRERARSDGARVLGVIPARYDSTRFPGKALHPLAGKPLVQWAWERCQRASGLDAVVIATDDERIAEAGRGFGADICLTRNDHQSGTDRTAEVARKRPRFSHIINIQGDEPLVPPALINRLARHLIREPETPMVTAAHAMEDPRDIRNENIVKVVLNKSGKALYFSRSVMPFQRRIDPRLKYYRHMGIYGYSRQFLLQFVRWKPSPLEVSESLEQLRALENGASIHVLITKVDSPGVDTPAQARALERRLRRIT